MNRDSACIAAVGTGADACAVAQADLARGVNGDAASLTAADAGGAENACNEIIAFR